MTNTSSRKPIQARAEVTKLKILDVARRHFADRGFEAANTRDIASEADVSHAMIRYHFGTKDLLWREAVRDMFQRLREVLGLHREGAPNLETKDGFREFLHRYIHYCAQNPEHSRIMIWESVRGGERLSWMANEFIKPAHSGYAKPVMHLMNKGDLPHAWHTSLMFIISAVCQMPFVLAAEARELYEVDMLSDEAIEAHIDSVFAFLFRDPSRQRISWPPKPLWLREASNTKED